MGAGEASRGVPVGGHPHQAQLHVRARHPGGGEQQPPELSNFDYFSLQIDKLNKSGATSSSSGFDDVENLLDEEIDKTLHIKGQMVYMKEWEQMLFLACPMMSDLNNLLWSGLFINDLSMHDYSRDIMLATTQEKIQMKMTLQTMEKKSAKLDEQQKKLSDVMKKSDDIIAQMLPKSVAEDLAKGKTNAEIQKTYECVTMLFSDVVRRGGRNNGLIFLVR